MPSAAELERLLKAYLNADQAERQRIELAVLVTLHKSIRDVQRELRRFRRRDQELHDDIEEE